MEVVSRTERRANRAFALGLVSLPLGLLGPFAIVSGWRSLRAMAASRGAPTRDGRAVVAPCSGWWPAPCRPVFWSWAWPASCSPECFEPAAAPRPAGGPRRGPGRPYLSRHRPRGSGRAADAGERGEVRYPGRAARLPSLLRLALHRGPGGPPGDPPGRGQRRPRRLLVGGRQPVALSPALPPYRRGGLPGRPLPSKRRNGLASAPLPQRSL